MMNISKIIKVSSSALLAFSVVNPAFALGEAIGINSAVKGNVSVQSGNQNAKQAVVKDDVLLGDAITSALDSSLQVLLKDETIFTVGPDCELIIDKFVYDPSKITNNMGATVSKGMFRFMSGNISKSGTDNVSINTPVASIGIRGTIAEGIVGQEAVDIANDLGIITPSMAVDSSGATLFILRGPGKQSVANGKKGEVLVTSAGVSVVLKKAGTAVFIPDVNSPPSEPFELPARTFERISEVLRTEPGFGPSYSPFPLDTFLKIDPLIAEPDILSPHIILDNEVADWPIDIEDSLLGPGGNPCTPNNPDFPACLL